MVRTLLAVTVMTLGFLAGTRPDVERRSLNEESRLPPATTIVLLVDRAPDTSAVYPVRQVDFTQAISRGARIVFVAGPNFTSGLGTAVMNWLRDHLRFDLHSVGSLEIRSLVPALQRWFDDQRAHAAVYLDAGAVEAGAYRDLQVLAQAEAADGTRPVSLRYRQGRAEIVFVPLLRVGPDSEDVVLVFLEQLAGATEYPDYLDELDLGGESGLRGELEALEQRRSTIEEELAAARRRKQILYFTDLELEREVVRFLVEELGIQARHVAGSDEDFRLVDAHGAEWGIGEVKGYGTRSVPRDDLARVAIHRSEAGFDEDAPALLVANTFHAHTTLADRDQPIAHNVIRRAAEDHILVVRTLDLVRLKQLALDDQPQTDALVKAVRDRGGWFEVTSELRVRIHPTRA